MDLTACNLPTSSFQRGARCACDSHETWLPTFLVAWDGRSFSWGHLSKYGCINQTSRGYVELECGGCIHYANNVDSPTKP